jgi:RHS repeat-associated protein
MVTSTVWAQYPASGSVNNQVTSTNASGSTATYQYDQAGDVTFDGQHQYLYDAEGRICAVQTASAPGVGTGPITGYIYDADGTRVAKGTIQNWTCDPSANGFSVGTGETDYILGPSGEQETELAWDSTANAMSWRHSNVWADGQLLGTYDTQGLHFYLDDWLGNRRVQTDYLGIVEQTCTNAPFGDSFNCGGTASYPGSPNLPTEHHFTGKELDAESGNNYFGARYYSSNMGRFLSPDWSVDPDPVPYSDLENPQSFNLYGYVNNNPLSNTDADGHSNEGCTTTSSTGPGGTIQVTVSCPDISLPEIDTVSPAMPFLILGQRLAFAGAGETSEMCATGIGCAVPAGLVLAGVALELYLQNHHLSKNNIPKDAADPHGAKAPGKPGEQEGFKDPKTGPKWGKAPNGKYRWVDAKGNVWVPTGQGSLAHGGPHWDVQNEDGSFGGSKYPGGFSR